MTLTVSPRESEHIDFEQFTAVPNDPNEPARLEVEPLPFSMASLDDKREYTYNILWSSVGALAATGYLGTAVAVSVGSPDFFELKTPIRSAIIASASFTAGWLIVGTSTNIKRALSIRNRYSHSW